MNKFIKTSATLLLMLCTCIGVLSYFVFDAAQFCSKMEAGENIRDSKHLEVIKMPLNEFNNNRADDEVWVNGHLYDISNYTVSNDTVLVSVFHDKDEEAVITAIVYNFDQNNFNSRGNSVRLGKHQVVVPDDGKILLSLFSINTFTFQQRRSFFAFYPSYSLQYSCSVITPPPDKVFS